jgi:hypothetical protein
VSRTTLLLASAIVSALLFFTFSESSARSLLHVDRDRNPERISGLPWKPLVGKPVAAGRAGANGNGNSNGNDARRRGSKPQVPIIAESLRYDADGLVRDFGKVVDATIRAGFKVRDEVHPISQLLQRGKRRWDGLLKR